MTYKAKAPSKKTDQLGFRPKRFWSGTSTIETKNGFEIHLDSRPVKTPKGHLLVLPTHHLAQLIEGEWAGVVEYVEFTDMPLTRLGFASVDRIGEVQDTLVAEVLRYAETDLLCYPSEYPAALQVREDAIWLPVLAWTERGLGLHFHQNRTLIHKPQPMETLERLRTIVLVANTFEQAGIMLAIPLLGSVVLSLALWKGHLTGMAAFTASRIGEDFQAETWGQDAEATKRTEGMRRDAVSLETWFKSLSQRN